MAITACMLLFATGCSSGPPAKVQGTVEGTVVSNGKPVTEGVVGLSAPKLGIGAVTKLTAEGKFKFETPFEIGDYVATVSIPESDSAKVIIDPKKYPHIPKKYHSPTTSNLPVKVIKGANKVDLTLQY